MNKRTFVLLLGLATYLFTGLGNAVNAQSIHKLPHLLSLSNRNLIYSTTSVWKDSILALCAEVEQEAWESEDWNTAFLAAQIKVNATCLKGGTGEAIVQAQEMYEKAKLLNSSRGRALSLQAIGDTYMHTGLYALAVETFLSAEAELQNNNDAFIKLRLVIQQIYAYLKMNEVEKAMEYLDIAERLLPQNLIGKEDFEFYIQSYRTLGYIQVGNKELFEKYWEKATNLQRTNEYLSELSLDLYISYYLFQKNYTKAVTLYDSLIVATKERGNLYEYKNALQSKGALLHILEDLQQAAVLYH